MDLEAESVKDTSGNNEAEEDIIENDNKESCGEEKELSTMKSENDSEEDKDIKKKENKNDENEIGLEISEKVASEESVNDNVKPRISDIDIILGAVESDTESDKKEKSVINSKNNSENTLDNNGILKTNDNIKMKKEEETGDLINKKEVLENENENENSLQSNNLIQNEKIDIEIQAKDDKSNNANSENNKELRLECLEENNNISANRVKLGVENIIDNNIKDGDNIEKDSYIPDITVSIGFKENTEENSNIPEVSLDLRFKENTEENSNIPEVSLDLGLNENTDENSNIPEVSLDLGFNENTDEICRNDNALQFATNDIDFNLSLGNDGYDKNKELDSTKEDIKGEFQVILPKVQHINTSRKSIGIIEVNLERLKQNSQVPDIHIQVDMDEINKYAIFTIEMPENWTNKIIKKNEISSNFNVMMTGSQQSENREQDFSTKTECKRRPKERFDIEISMILDEFDLEDSSLIASINSKKENDSDMPLDSPTKKDDFGFSFSNILCPFLKNKSNPDDNLENENEKVNEIHVNASPPLKRYDFRYQLPKIEFPFFGEKPKSDADLDLDIKENDNNIEIKKYIPDNEESLTKKHDFYYQLPKIELSYFDETHKAKLDDIEINKNVEIEKNIPENNTDADTFTKWYEFKYEFPKIELPFFGDKEKTNSDIGNIETNISDDELKVEGPTTRYDFRYQLPKIEFPFFSDNPKTDVDIDINNKENINDVEIKVDIKNDNYEESPSKRYDFRYQLPKIEFPFFRDEKIDPILEPEITYNTSETDVSVDIRGIPSESEINSDYKTRMHDFRFQLPTIEMDKTLKSPDKNFDSITPAESIGIKLDSSRHNLNLQSSPEIRNYIQRSSEINEIKHLNPDLHVEINVNGPSYEKINDKKPFKAKIDTNVKFPESTLRIQDINTVKNVEMSLENDIEVKESPKIYDFRYQLPKIELPLFGSRVSDDVEVYNNNTYTPDINIDVNTKFMDTDINGEPAEKRLDFRIKLPSIVCPPFWGKKDFHNAVADIDLDSNRLDIDADLDLSTPEVSPKSTSPSGRYDFQFQLPTFEFPSFEEKKENSNSTKNSDITDNKPLDEPVKRHDFRYKLPSFKFSSFVGAEDNSKNSEIVPNDYPSVDARTSLDKDITKETDFKFQLPKLEFPFFNSKDSLKSKEKSYDFSLSKDTMRYNFTFSYPLNKFNIVDEKVTFVNSNENMKIDKHGLLLFFDGGDNNENNIFKIQLINDTLICTEYFNGEWQQEISCNVICISPKKNILITLLSKEDSQVVILFNHEVMMKYLLRGSITTLTSFQREGAVILNTAKLYDQ